MHIINVGLGNCFVGVNQAYIYILYSKAHHFAYVGETNGESGVISRLCAHVKLTPTMGTLRSRVLDRCGIELNEVMDLCVFSCSLPNDPTFTGVERTYRRGVEYLVQKHLWEICGKVSPYLRPVAHVDYSDAVTRPYIKAIAQQISDKFVELYTKT